MKKIESLNELRCVLSGLLEKAQNMQRLGCVANGTETAWEVPQSEPCVVFLAGKLDAEWRRRKPEGSVEIFRITKSDRSDGATPLRANFYLVKLAKFLEKRDLYAHREIITAETGSLLKETQCNQ